MNLLDYLDKYKNRSFKDMPFNEIDALAMADFSYVAFDELKLDKEKIKAPELLKLINAYEPKKEDSERKLNYLKVAKYICEGHRYNKALFAHFRKINDHNSDKQFQAITIILKDLIYISYCGTDSTILGWKEDFNMAVLDVVPSEIEAIKYVNMVTSKHWFKKIYLGGHSKGGRLAISAAKGAIKKKRIAMIFAFDAPNYPPSAYDENYKSIDSKIISYAPNESIIGRLMNEYHQKRIIKSTNTLLMQHDTFSWLIEGKSFVYDNAYTPKSTRISKTINHALTNYDAETKKVFVETLFGFLDRLNIEKLPNEKEFIPYFMQKGPELYKEWKNIPDSNKAVIKKIIFDLLKDYFFSKN